MQRRAVCERRSSCSDSLVAPIGPDLGRAENRPGFEYPCWSRLAPTVLHGPPCRQSGRGQQAKILLIASDPVEDRKSTRLNSSHGYISYAVFCLKKKKKIDSVAQHARESAHNVAT